MKSKVDHGYFPKVTNENNDQYGVLLDNNYKDEEARGLDAAWNVFHSGYIGMEANQGLNVWSEKQFPLHDEYRFVRKNFSAIWSTFILVFRIITLHNPFAEWMGWWKTRNEKRLNHATTPFEYPLYKDFKSKLIEAKPLVSIIIPTLNRYPYLKDVLRDLESQTYNNFEVIVVDQSDPFQEEFYKGLKFPIRFWYQSEKALWKARNDAIRTAKGDYILLYDDDSRVEADWIEQHVKSLDFFNADISSGVSISVVGAKVPAHYAYFRWSDQLDTGNVLIKQSVFEQIGLFDRQFEKQRMGDGEFGLRAYLAGFRNISNPYAKRIHLKVAEGGLRQMGSWDGWRPKKVFAPRPVPSVLYLYRRYFGTRASLLALLTGILPATIPYRYKKSKILIVFALLLSPLLLPLLSVQILMSWHAASKKLKTGPMIETLSHD